ncbi:MAG: GNAT family N-acetyltransferase [Alphaproteobacteria bacterium]|nr:GNAT family N-acetyltransferase [Alphaproteobacteria bacterium]
MAIQVRQLQPGNDLLLSDFLERRADSSMFIRANLRHSGLADTGKPYSGTYVAAFSGAAIEAVAALFWSGTVILQAPFYLGPILNHLTGLDVRPIKTLLGPLSQTDEARRLLGLRNAPTKKTSREDLFALGLERLVMPEHLAAGTWVSRRPKPNELRTLVDWRIASVIETNSASDDEEQTRRDADEVIRRLDRESAIWVLEVDGRVVSMNSFNAVMPEMVQVGGVFTPPDLRGFGFARACVAGSLAAARHRGVERAVLFTPKDNAAAQTAYRAIGFRLVGDYGIVVFG